VKLKEGNSYKIDGAQSVAVGRYHPFLGLTEFMGAKHRHYSSGLPGQPGRLKINFVLFGLGVEPGRA
jgi:hypothetical protein